MAVDTHPSRKPSPPRRPPATSTTDGTINKMNASASGQSGVEYGARHQVQVKDPNRSEMAHHFAGRAGQEHPQEGTVSRASKPGDE